MPIFKLCRICLTECKKSEKMQPLFDNNERCVEIVKQIEECGGIVLKLHEEFPKMICLRCLENLNTSYKFRAMCQASEHSLLNVVVKSEMKIEPETESRSNIYFDAEFIDAEEVDFADITDDHRQEDCDDDEFLDEIQDIEDETSQDFVLASESDNADIDYFDDDVNDGDYQVEVKKEQSKSKPIKAKKSSSSKAKSGRQQPRVQSAPVSIKKEKTVYERGQFRAVQTTRGRKKNVEDVPASIMCEICGNIYAKQSLLNMHMRRHMADKPFECEICSKTFACPSEIRRHMRVHTGEKPYVCKFCGRTFADRSTNIKHERIHTNERPFICNTCGKSFTYSNVLKNHMLTHTGEKPFPCLACNKTFSRKHQLDQHCATLTHQQTVKNLNLCENVNIEVKEQNVAELLNTSIVVNQ